MAEHAREPGYDFVDEADPGLGMILDRLERGRNTA